VPFQHRVGLTGRGIQPKTCILSQFRVALPRGTPPNRFEPRQLKAAQMDVFGLHKHVISEYAGYTQSFIRIADTRVRDEVTRQISQGLLWPDPLIQLNPSFAPGGTIDALVKEGVLHEKCSRIFRIKQHDNDSGMPLNLHRHQVEAIRKAREGRPYVLTTGTGSGKSLCYIIPLVDHVLRTGSGQGIKGIVVYPMNALANSQMEELEKFLKRGMTDGKSPVTFQRYTGQESASVRQAILSDPPDILLTNYVMLELILTRLEERQLINAAKNLRFLVLDELHTYRGRQGADVAMLVRRCRESLSREQMICVGTSATMASEGDSAAQAEAVARVSSIIFGQTVQMSDVIPETLLRTTNEIDFTTPEQVSDLRIRIESSDSVTDSFDELKRDPLATWIETTFGLRRESTAASAVMDRSAATSPRRSRKRSMASVNL
jgi:ATP-dependent helicase YprA (DUF1998 family)